MPESVPISVCIILNKWHPKLPETLRSYQGCCDEIIVGINGGFNPESFPEIKEFSRIKWIKLDWEGYGNTKNKLSSIAKNDWIFSVDSDEVADAILQNNLRNFQPKNSSEIYGIKMFYYLGTKKIKYGAWRDSHLFLRLYNKKHSHWDNQLVHEGVIVPENSTTQILKGHILHYTAENYQQLLEKNRNYAELSAKKYAAKGIKYSMLKSVLKASFNFFKNYVLRLGFLDGYYGFQIAKAMAVYTYWKYSLIKQYQ